MKQKAAQAADAAAEEKRLAGEGVPVEQQRAVKAVLAALDRAQRAAEEAAASSTALELAMYQAEYTGALSSSDEEDWVKAASDGEGGEEDGGGGVQQQKAAQPSRAVGS